MIKIKFAFLYEKIPDKREILFINKVTKQLYKEDLTFLYGEEGGDVWLSTIFKIHKFLWFKWEEKLVSFEHYCGESSLDLDFPIKNFDEISSIIVYYCEKFHPEINFNIRLHGID